MISSPLRPLPAPSLLASALAFALVSVAMLALYWWPEAKTLLGDEGHYQRAALAIVSGEDGFDRSMTWPPLQAHFIALVYRLSGPHILAVQLLQLLLLAGAGVLLRYLLLGLGEDRDLAGWAGVLLAVNPLTVAFATYLWPEIVHLVLSVSMAVALFHAHARRAASSRRLLWAGLAGACLALCLLSKSLLTAFWPLLLVPLIERRQWRGSSQRVLVFGLAALLLMAPTLYRGWQETGRPMIADSSWFNLWVGLNDRWRSDLGQDDTGDRMREYLASAPDHVGRVAYAQSQALTIVHEQGVVRTGWQQLGRQYFRLFDSRHFAVAQLPGERCVGYRSTYSVRDPVWVAAIDTLLRGWHLALLVLFAFGITAWCGWQRPWLWLAGAFVGYQLALLGVLHVKTRFLIPMLPVLCLFAGYALARLREPALAWSRGRWLAGIALAIVLVALATLGPWLDAPC